MNRAVARALESLEQRRLLTAGLPIGASPFETDFGGIDSASAVAFDSVGNVVLAGNSGSNFAVARRLPGGSLDTSFSGDGLHTFSVGGSAQQATSLLVDASGRAFLGGFTFSGVSTNIDFALARVSNDGSTVSVAAPVNFTGSSSDQIATLVRLSGGQVIAIGTSNGNLALARYDATTLAPITGGGGGFNATGRFTTSIPGGATVAGAFVDGSDRITVAATDASNNLIVARYNSEGTLDASFGTAGILTIATAGETARGIALQANGQAVLVSDDGSNASLRRLGATGTVLATSVNFASGSATGVVVQAHDQRIAVALTSGGQYKLTRLNADLSFDSSDLLDGSGSVTAGSGVTTAGIASFSGTGARRLAIAGTVSDNVGLALFDANINPSAAVVDADVDGNSDVEVPINGTRLLTQAILNAADLDDLLAPNNNPATVSFSVSAAPAKGSVQVFTGSWTNATSFTIAQLLAGQVRYAANPSATGADTIGLSIADSFGGTTTGYVVPISITSATPVYVDDDWTITTDTGVAGLSDGDVVSDSTDWTSALGSLVFGVNAFSNINDAIAAVAIGGTVSVLSGTYAQNVLVNKSITLLGRNSAAAGSGSRSAESTIVADSPNVAANLGAVVRVTADDVTIKGLLITGDGAGAGAPVHSGADANALYAISNGSTAVNADIEGLVVENNVLQQTAIGVFLRRGTGAVPAAGVSDGNQIKDNLLRDIGVFDFGYGISWANNVYGDISGNVMRRVHTGVVVNNNGYDAAPASGVTITGNDIQSYASALWHNQSYSYAPASVVSGNTFGLATTNHLGGAIAPVANSIGLLVTGGPGFSGINLTGNAIAGFVHGAVVWGTDATLTINATNTISGSQTGLLVTNNVGFNPIGSTALNLVGTPSSVTLDNAGISAGASGTAVVVRGDAGGGAATVTLQNGVQLGSAATGLRLAGPLAQLGGNSLGDTAFAGSQSTYVELLNGAETSTRLDGTAATYGGVVGSAATLAQSFAIEDKIAHAVDGPASFGSPGSVGFVRTKSSNVYVTPTSSSIQRGVDAATAGDTVHVDAGTYSGNVVVNKSLTLLGNQNGVDARGRAAVESVITAATGTLLQVNADDVTVDGFKLDGQDAASTGYATSSSIAVDNAVLLNTIVDNLDASAGSAVEITNPDGQTSTGLLVSRNDIRSDTGVSTISLSYNAYGTVSENKVYVPFFGFGISAFQYYLATASPTLNTLDIADNEIVGEARMWGIYTNLVYGSANDVNITGNSIDLVGGVVAVEDDSPSGAENWDTWAMNIWSTATTAQINIEDNVIGAATPGTSNFTRGMNIWNAGVANVSVAGASIARSSVGIAVEATDSYYAGSADTVVEIEDVTITGGDIGIHVRNRSLPFTPVGTSPAPADGEPDGSVRVNLTGGSIVGATTGIVVADTKPSDAFTASLQLVGGTTISNGTTGLRLAGAQASLVGNTLDDTLFSGQTGNYVSLLSNAAFNTRIDGTNATYDGVLGSSANLAQGFSIEDKILHAVDGPAGFGSPGSVGFVRTKSSNVYVTPTSGSIQRGVDAASAGDIVNVETGTYSGAVNLNKSVTLLGDAAGKPTITLTSGSAAALVRVGAPNVVVQNFTLATVRPNVNDAIYADKSATGNFDGLQIVDNTFTASGTGGMSVHTGSGSRGVAIALHDFTGSNVPNVTLRGNDIQSGTTSGTGLSFTRGLWTYGILPTVGGATVADGNQFFGTFQDALLQFPSQSVSSATAMLVRHNTFTGAGAEVTEPNANVAVTFRDNTFAPNVGHLGFAPRQALFVNHNYSAGATVTVDDNALVTPNGNAPGVPAVGLFIGGSRAVTITGNAFDAATGASNFVHVMADTQFREGGDGIQYGDDVPDSLDLRGNDFNGGTVAGGVGLALYNGNSTRIATGTVSGSQYGAYTIGGAGADANAFGENLAQFIQLNAVRNPIFPSNLGPTVPGPVTLDLDATGNTFDVGAGPQLPGAMALAQRFDVEDKIRHKLDVASLGHVRFVAGRTFVTPVSGSIQRGVDAATSGDTVHVKAGTYAEFVSVNKSADVLGPNAGIAGNGSRVAEAIVVPPSNDLATGRLFSVAAADVSIRGFTLDGDNPLVSGGASINSVDVNAADGVYASNSGGLDVSGNRILNLAQNGVRLTGTIATGDSSVSQNLIDNVAANGPTYFGRGVLLQENAYASVTDNVITRARAGIQTNNFHLANPGAAAVISGNDISYNVRGIFHNLHYSAASPFTIANNAIVAGPGAIVGAGGLQVFSIQSGVSTTLSNNTISGGTYGIQLWNLPTTSTVSVTGGSVTGSTYGIWATNLDPSFGSAAATSVALSGIAIANSGTAGIFLDGSGANAISLAIGSGVAITGGPTGLRVSGAQAALTGNTLGTLALSGQSNYYVELQNGALTGVDVNGAATTFGGVVGGSASLAQSFAIEDKLGHELDDATVGRIDFKPGQLFVTTPGTGASDESIQRAVDAADAGDTVHIQSGTYIENVSVGKDIDLVGDSTGATTVTASGGSLFTVSGSGFGTADNEVTITDVNLDGGSLADSGVSIQQNAALGRFALTGTAPRDVKNFRSIGVGVFGSPTSGDAVLSALVGDVDLSKLSFANNGIAGGGGTGDIQFYGYNNDATLSDLTLVGSRNEGAGSGARLGIQFRGIGTGAGSGVSPIGNVSLVNVDVSGKYRNQFIGIQRYSNLAGLSFAGVKLGGANSEVTGTFGASLRFDGVGTGSLAAPATFDLGNTLFRGLAGSSAQRHEIEFAPDNAFSFLRVDATNTSWDVGGVVPATSLDLAQAFAVEDRILHYSDKLNPTHGLTFGGYKGFVDVQANRVFVTDSPDAGLVGDNSINRAIQAIAVNGTVHVDAGSYDEDVLLDKAGVKLLGSGSGSTSIVGPIGGSGATVTVGASNVEIAGFTITRAGNNLTDWNNPALNSAGVAIQGLSITAALIRDNVITGNRTGIDINNSGGHTVRQNFISDNRTGMILRNQTDGLLVTQNFITDNWTVGVLFLDASGGTNSPPQQAVGSQFFNNDISGNWYGQVVDRQTGGSLPAPGTNKKTFVGNWFGTAAPTTSLANSAEPGYAAQIPLAFGGTAVAPGGQPDILGPASANIDFAPVLTSGVDTNVVTAPGVGTFGFQGNLALLGVSIAGAATTNEGSVYTLQLSPLNPGSSFITGWTIDWGDGSAPTVIVGNPTTATHAYTDGPNNWVITATATTTLGAATANTVAVAVDNVAPTSPINGYVATSDEGTPLSFTSNLFDPAGVNDTYSYLWTVTRNAAPYAVTANTGPSFTFTPDDEGSYVVTLVVTDSDGASTSTSTPAIVVGNVAPTLGVVTISPGSINEGDSVTIAGTYADVGSADAHTLELDLDNDGIFEVTGVAISGGSFSYNYVFADDNPTLTASDVRTVNVRVRDDDAAPSNVQSPTVTVNNVAPTAVITGAFTGNEGSAFNFTSSVVDPGLPSDVITYAWTVTKNGLPFATGNASTFSFTPDNSGPGAIWQLQLVVTDDDAGTNTYSQALTVNDVAPTIVVAGSAPSVNESGTANYTLTLSDLFDAGSGDRQSVEFLIVNWGDGTQTAIDLTGPTPTIAGGSTPTAVLSGSPANLAAGAGPLSSGTIVLSKTYLDGALAAAPVQVAVLQSIKGLYADTGTPTSVTVNNVAPSRSGFTRISPDPIASGGSATVNWSGALVEPSPTDVTAGVRYAYAVDVDNDGIYFETGEIAFGGTTWALSVPNSTVVIGGALLVNNSGAPVVRTIVSRIIDKDGGFTQRTATVTVNPSTFQVSSFTPNASGFDVVFNRAFDTSVLNIWSRRQSGDPLFNARDVVLSLGGTEIRGSIVLGPDTDPLTAGVQPDRFTFVKTGGILADGNYSVTLFSGPGALRDLSGNALDGVPSSPGVENYLSAFSFSLAGQRVLSVPDFARGWSDGASVQVPASLPRQSQLPVSINAGADVNSFQFLLKFDPALLQINGITLSQAAIDAGFTFVGAPYQLTPGTWVVEANNGSNPGLVTSSVTTLLNVDAIVLGGGTYGVNQAIRIENAFVNGPAAVGDTAVHAYAYLGDAGADALLGQRYTAGDVTLVRRVAALLDQGFLAYPLTDPTLIGDIDGVAGFPAAGGVGSGDATLLARRAAGLTVGQIPPVPGELAPILAPGSSPAGTPGVGTSGDVYSAPIAVTTQSRVVSRAGATHRMTIDAVGQPTTAASFQYLVEFDPSVFTLDPQRNVALGALARARGFTMVANLVAPGRLLIIGSGMQSLGAAAGSLLELSFSASARASGNSLITVKPIDAGLIPSRPVQSLVLFSERLLGNVGDTLMPARPFASPASVARATTRQSDDTASASLFGDKPILLA